MSDEPQKRRRGGQPGNRNAEKTGRNTAAAKRLRARTRAALAAADFAILAFKLCQIANSLAKQQLDSRAVPPKEWLVKLLVLFPDTGTREGGGPPPHTQKRR